MSADECMLTMCDDTADVTCERGECTCLAKATTMAPSTDTSKSFKNSTYSFFIHKLRKNRHTTWNLKEGEIRWVGYSQCTIDLRDGSPCFLEQETLPSLFSTGWLQEQIRA